MKFLCWNIRILNSPAKQLTLMQLLNSSSHSLICLIENKLTSEHISRLVYKMGSNGDSNLNHTGTILLLWDSNIWSTIILDTDSQYITCILHNAVCLSKHLFMVPTQLIKEKNFGIISVNKLNLIFLGSYQVISILLYLLKIYLIIVFITHWVTQNS